MKIYIDLDGVLYSWNNGVCRLFGLNPKSLLLQHELKIQYGQIEHKLGFDTVKKEVIAGRDFFWEDLEKFEWTNILYDRICDIVGKQNVYFCTAYGGYFDAASAKAKVIYRDFQSKNVILISDKFLLANRDTLLIDDKPENVSLFQAHGGRAFLWPNEYKIAVGEASAGDAISQITEMIIT